LRNAEVGMRNAEYRKKRKSQILEKSEPHNSMIKNRRISKGGFTSEAHTPRVVHYFLK
jgi:hypothetical protein